MQEDTNPDVHDGKVAILFGGTGFIGLHFARYLVDEAGFGKVILADLKPPEQHLAHRFIASEISSGKIVYAHCDVRNPINGEIAGAIDSVSLIANFAAIHREPGHDSEEYYLTNLPGAENVCNYAELIDCNTIIFTSSIAPYGPSELPKDESFVPTPETAYGGSKLAAEWIHRSWQSADVERRRLLIARPGVVFGPGEGGNVSRLVRAIEKGFFVYAGNRETRKAGIYIRELCHAMWWSCKLESSGVSIFNMSMMPGPSVEEYVQATESVLGKRAFIPNIPAWCLLLAARIIGSISAAIGVETSINYTRVRKLVRSNNIIAKGLSSRGYQYRFNLVEAMQDWQNMAPAEWQGKNRAKDVENSTRRIAA